MRVAPEAKMAAYSGDDSKLLYFVFREGEFEGFLSEVALSMTKNPINNSEARKKSSKFHPPGWSTGFLDPETAVVFSEPRPGREHAYSKKFVGSINFKNHDFRRQNLEFKKSEFRCV